MYLSTYLIDFKSYPIANRVPLESLLYKEDIGDYFVPLFGSSR
jgi:hypothetical protein